jgi:UDP-glucose 4-epimerase
MNVLVTGGAGFIGTNLIKRLLSDGHNVVSIDNYSAGKKENHQDGCRYWTYDLTDKYCPVLEVDEYDVIFHLAALARIQPSLKDPHKTIFNNFVSTLNVLECARKNKIKFVYAGSSSFHHGLYSSSYAWSKYGGEELCKLYSEVYDVSTVICRFYNVYGPHQLEDGNYATVIGIFEKQYREVEPLTITADGKQRRDFTHVDDIVDALVLCMGKEFKAEIFELGSGVNYSINEVADMFDKYYIKEYIPARKGEYDRTLCDYSKAQLKLGWKPTRNLEDYIDKIKLHG